MASRFVLTAQVQLQAPTNTRQVVNQIQQQLRGVNVQVNLQGGQQASRQVNNLNKATKQATTQATKMGKAFGASIRRFGAFTIATRAVSLFSNSLANATKEAIDFEREMIKISQVTGKTMAQLKGLENTITDLSTSLGVSSKSILSVGRILSQAGIQAGDLEVALRTLAKTELAPTFDDITKTAEGAVAVLAQFGQGVGELERQLGAINRVAGQFAVESGDLISVIRRTGGVFKAAGGDLEELIALFTSVRATTRESAESIATGLRTIFTRIQRPKTIEFLKQFGVELTDLNGKFIGPFEAIRQLSQALSGLEQGDIQFVRIAEELGGFRQIGKVIPLLQQFETAEKARQAALEGGDSLTKDAAKAQQALAVQISKVKEEFLALIRSITQTASFQTFVKTSLELASALIKVADSLKPLIPLLAAFGAIKFAKGAAGFARGIGAGLRGGNPTGFARGGMVPGSGNRDTVPAMLTPGEFVIRKSSVKSLGADTLAQMNENKREKGTPGVRGELVKRFSTDIVSSDVGTKVKKGKSPRSLEIMEREFIQEADLDTYGAAFLRPFGKTSSLLGKTDPNRIKDELAKSKTLDALGVKVNKKGTSFLGGAKELTKSLASMANKYAKLNTFKLQAGSMPQAEAEALEDIVLGGVENTIREGASRLGKITGMKTPVDVASVLKSSNIDQTTGNIFEGMLAFAGAPFGSKAGDAANAPFDFDKGLGSALAAKFDLDTVASRPTEAKSTFTSDALISVAKKVENRNIAEAIADFQSAFLDAGPQIEKMQQAELERKGFSGTRAEQDQRIASLRGRKRRFASGGGISGSDTIPAMLTPGEFVFNKKAAQSIGYSNLSRMNTKGVQGFANGGPVGFRFGGKAAKENISDSFSREGTALVTTMSQVDDIMSEFINSLSTLPEGVRQSVVEMTKTFELTKAQQFKTNAGDRSGDQLRGVATASGVGINLKKAGEHTVKHEGAHQVDRALGGGRELASRQEGTFQNKIAKELQKTMEAELGASAYRLDTAELFADAMAKAPPEVQRILASTTDAAEGSKKLAEHFEKAGGPIAGLADLSADEFGGIQDPTKRKKSAKKTLKENVKIRDSARKKLGAVEGRLKTEADKKSALEARRDSLLKAQSAASGGVGGNPTKGKEAKALTESQLKAKQQYEIITKELTEQTKLINESDNSIKILNKSRDKYKRAIDTAQGKIVSSSERLKGLKGKKAAKSVDMVKPSGKVKDLTPEVFKLRPPPRKKPPETFNIEVKPEKTKGKEEQEKKQSVNREKENINSNRMTNLLLGATAMAAFIPEVEGATEGMGGLINEIPGVIGGFAAMQGIAQGIPEGESALTKGLFSMAKGALQTASFTIAASKAIDAYNGTHLQAEEAVKAASEANDEASLAAAEKAAVESANAKNLNKAGAAVSGAFGAAAGVAEMIPGPWGKVAGIGLKVIGAIAGVAVKMGALEKIFGITGDNITNFFSLLGMGPNTTQIKAQTAATIQNARSQKILAEASKDAAEELKKIEAGDITATESLGAGGAAAKSAQAIAAQNQASKDIIEANNKANALTERVSNALMDQGGFTGAISSGIFDFFTGGQKAANNQQSEAEKKAITDRNSKLIDDLQPRLTMSTRERVTAASAAGQDISFDDFKSKIDPSILALAANTDEMNGNTAEMDKLRQNFQNVKEATIENIKFIKAMNFGLSSVTSGIEAYGASLNNLVASQETGFSTAAVAATTLSTAISSAGANISSAELGQSLDLLENNLQKFGANAKQISGARDLITGLNDVQKGASDALAAVKAGFKGGSTDPKAIQGQLRDAILDSIPDSSPIKQRLLDSFPDELPPEAIENFLNTGDVSGILDQAFGPIQEQVQKQLIGPLNKLAEQEKVLVGLTLQRREAEQKLIAVQKQAIDTQIDAAKSLEFFGGPKFTPEREFAARRQQANLTLQDAGIAGLTTGSAADIRRASQDIGSRFSTQQAAQNAAAIRGKGAFGGVAGVDADRRPELKEANKELIQITKQGIAQRKQELELIKKKNQAEKSALDSLLGGDVESFFEQSIGAAAGSALRTGDTAAASLFGAGALGKGLQGLQGTGLSDTENKRASQLAFGAFGLGDRAASVFSGTTTEEERIKAEGRELAQLQSELADQSTELEEMNVTATTVVISAANLKMQAISDQVTRAQKAAGFNRGGVVYANKGMFIPRGTDTVPAMLTPGEFVVNRSAVQRGNNLQILRSMNSNSAPIQATQALSSGGPVRYRANGSTGPEGPGGIDFSKFEEMVNKFQEVTDKLGNVNIKHMFEKLGTLDINHMFNGNMQQAFKDEILAEAGNMMSRSKFNSDGGITTSDRSVLG